MGHRTTRPHATLKACRIRWYAVALAVLTWLAGAPVLAQTGTAHVDRVIDGDTISVRLDGARCTVRLTGVDTPETTHPTRGVEPHGPDAALKPHPSTKSRWRVGYADASAHRILSDLSAFIGHADPTKQRILAAGDLNMFYGATGPEAERFTTSGCC